MLLAIVAITGSNYFTLYAGITLALLILAHKDKTLLKYFILGCSLGLIHLPSVAYLIGRSRANAVSSIAALSMSPLGILSSLSIGIARPVGWETWAPVGVPTVILFFKIFVDRIWKSITARNLRVFSSVEIAWLGALVIMALLSTGALYYGQHILDTFRVPSRAITFVALTVSLFVLQASRKDPKGPQIRAYLLASALQIGIVSFLIRPYGVFYGPYDQDAQALANVLKADHASSVWMSMQELAGADKLNSMYVQTVLTENELLIFH